MESKHNIRSLIIIMLSILSLESVLVWLICLMWKTRNNSWMGWAILLSMEMMVFVAVIGGVVFHKFMN